MVWTYLRACYKFNMRLFVGGIEQVYPARWFFCDPNALIFPSPHGAEASPWLKSFEVNQEWGEVAPYRGLDRGINPGYPGQCFVGDPQWFIDGHVPATLGVWIPPFVTPCCGHVPGASTDPRCPQPDPFACPNCVEGKSAPRYQCTFSGGTGAFSDSNGTFIIVWEFPCDYGFSDGQHFVGLHIVPDNAELYIQTNIPATIAIYRFTESPLHCLDPWPSLTLITQVPLTGTPPTVSVVPLTS